MRFEYRVGLCALIMSVGFNADAGAPDEQSVRRIAITFDDAPRADSPMLKGSTRATMLLQSLAKAEVKGAMFFATTGNLEVHGDEGLERLARYAKAGHQIANHSHAHASADRMDVDLFMRDVLYADAILRDLPGYAPYFRFPFLNEGETPAKRDAIRKALDAAQLRQGYVTVDNYDWYLQSLFDEAVASRQPLSLVGWRDLYVEVLLSAVEFYDAVAVRAVGRSVAHVLLLHENDLAALFIDDLVAALRHNGWQIVPADEAYEDPIAERAPSSMLLGQGRVVALAEQNGLPRRNLFHPLESEPELRSMAVKRGLVGFAEGAYLGQPAPGMRPQKFAPNVISLPDQYEYGAAFSADGKQLFFAVAQDGRGEIRSTRYRDGVWSPISTLLSHASHSFADPFLSRDETRLYFISDSPGKVNSGANTHDLGYLRRTRDGWSEPTWLGAPINTLAEEFYVSFTDAGALAFASGRNATQRGDFDLYLAVPDGESFAAPVRLPEPVNTRHYEADPFIAPDGSYILFASNRRPNQGKRDIYATFALDGGGWSDPVALGSGVNTAELELCPFVTRDGRFLIYTSNEDLYWVDATVIDLAKETADLRQAR